MPDSHCGALSCSIDKKSGKASILVNETVVKNLINLTIPMQQKHAQAHGFLGGKVPETFVREYQIDILTDHVKQLLLNYRVIHALMDEFIKQKIFLAGIPQLVDIIIDANKKAEFLFEFTTSEIIRWHDWKYFFFKGSKRKNYKDLDRQVENLIAEELENKQRYTNDKITIHDFVFFEVQLLNNNEQPFVDDFCQEFWFKMGNEEIETSLRDIFIGKKKGDSFISYDKGLQEIFSDTLQTEYPFLISIKDVLPHAYLDFDLFKKYFRLKTSRDMHRKLIEVFSFRHDISQRRLMVEELFNLLISKHDIIVPLSLMSRQKEKILRAMRANPDYTVYRRQADFDARIHDLSKRQAQELVLINQFVYAENITVNHEDIKGYLNLTKRARMKDYLHFERLDSTQNGHEIPVALEDVKRACLYEKGINHAIYHLTKSK